MVLAARAAKNYPIIRKQLRGLLSSSATLTLVANQINHRKLGTREEARLRLRPLRQADATIHIQGGRTHAIQAGFELLIEPRVSDQRSIKGQCDLPAVGMP